MFSVTFSSIFHLAEVPFDGQVKYLHRAVVTSPYANEPRLRRSAWAVRLRAGFLDLGLEDSDLFLDLEVGSILRQVTKTKQNKKLRTMGS